MKKTFSTIIILLLFICSSYGQTSEKSDNHAVENGSFNLANQKCIAHDYTGAISLYDEAIKIEPKNYLIYYNRAIAKLNLADNKGACIDLKKSLELGYGKASEIITQFCK